MPGWDQVLDGNISRAEWRAKRPAHSCPSISGASASVLPHARTDTWALFPPHFFVLGPLFVLSLSPYTVACTLYSFLWKAGEAPTHLLGTIGTLVRVCGQWWLGGEGWSFSAGSLATSFLVYELRNGDAAVHGSLPCSGSQCCAICVLRKSPGLREWGKAKI